MREARDLDAETALALLQWQAELGADEPLGEAGVDRFALGERATETPAPAAPAQAPLLPPDDPVARATALAAAAPDLETLAAAQEGFDDIELKRGAHNFVFADGPAHARLLILGEAPGDEEDRQGKPFVGRSGQLLDKMLAAIGLSRHDPDPARAVRIINVLPWHPPGNRDPRPDEVAMMLPFVRRHIDLAGPDVIVLMGNHACEAGLGRRGILRLRGQWDTAFGRPALPMTHPAYLLRNPAAKREAWADLLSLADRLDLPPV